MIDWDEAPKPLEQLDAEAELLRLVKYWRERYEALAEALQQSLRGA